jgi:hypothetical protein
LKDRRCKFQASGVSKQMTEEGNTGRLECFIFRFYHLSSVLCPLSSEHLTPETTDTVLFKEFN